MRKSREREARVLVEGVRACTEALDASAAVEFAVVSPRLDATAEGRALRERLVPFDVHSVTDDELEQLSDTERPQGVLVVCGEPPNGLADLRTTGGLLVLDALQDPGNVGTLVRSAVAFGLTGVVCLDGTVDPWSPKVVRASAGTIFRIPVVGAGLDAALRWLAGVDVTLLVASAGGTPVDRWLRGARRNLAGPRDRAFVLAVGNEGAGVRAKLADAADATIAIEMRGPAESLNVAIAGSILLHELAGDRSATPERETALGPNGEST
jgi:TrmH family RNA methyltransferase